MHRVRVRIHPPEGSTEWRPGVLRVATVDVAIAGDITPTTHDAQHYTVRPETEGVLELELGVPDRRCLVQAHLGQGLKAFTQVGDWMTTRTFVVSPDEDVTDVWLDRI